MVAALGPTIPNLIMTIAIVYTPILARVVSGPVLSVKRWDHVEAARSVGVSEFAIMVRHVLPLVISPILVETSLTLANTIFTVTALSFLGLGAPPTVRTRIAVVMVGKNDPRLPRAYNALKVLAGSQ